MEIKNLAEFEDFLKSRIPTRADLFMGDIGLRRAKHFMKLIGNPQNEIKVIHIAGTSGKGSTAHLTSHILASQGFSVGLSISPHVFDIRERMQINDQLPNEKMVLKYFNQILPMILKMEKSKFGMPTFFEINVALAFFMFAQEKLDYAVIETGLGGMLDATNTVTSKNKICIITKIGLDHTEILGNTIAKIASEKAGIIQNGNFVISTNQSLPASNIIKKRYEEKDATLQIIKPGKNYSIISSTPQETIFNFTFEKNNLSDIALGLIGKHQAENCCLALACLAILSKRDEFLIDEKLLRSMLRSIKIPGRMELLKIKGRNLIIDGAHNPQKMDALTSNLSAMFPRQKFSFIVAFKKGKDFKQMLKKIIPLADKIILTQFSTTGMDNNWISIDNQEISKFLKSQNFKNFKIISNKKTEILANIKASKKPVVITGSLYLISSIYNFLKK
ncbi:MAG: hypothetical protein ACD_8C00010G0003 [uncultured bacterium]|nr:MAG: hypothetical protein ACD_8C00010G0003 [uncultured bacterium]